MGSCTVTSQWNALRYYPGRIVQVKITEFCSTSDCVGFVWSRNGSKQWTDKLCTIENGCKTSCWSDDENSKLQGPERSCGHGMRHQESKRKESLRWEESGRVFSVGGTWTMFQRRLMWFQSWHPRLWKQRTSSEPKRTIVFSCIPLEGKTDWRGGTKILTGMRQ